MVVAYVFGWMLGLKKSQRSFAVAASMFMNSNSLPIALMQSLVFTVPNLKWGDDDNVNAMEWSYVHPVFSILSVAYMRCSFQLRWSYGVRLLATADPEAVEDLPADPLDHILRHERSSLTDVDDTKLLRRPARRRPKSLPSSRSYSPQPQPQASTSGAPPSPHGASDLRADIFTLAIPHAAHGQSYPQRLGDALRVHDRPALGRTRIAAGRVHPAGAAHPGGAHCTRQGRAERRGQCSIPLTLVVLGAYFYSPPEKDEGATERDGRLPTHKPLSRTPSWASRSTLYDQMRGMFSLKRRDGEPRQTQRQAHPRPGETKTVVVAVLSRMVITPLLLLPLMAVGARFDVQRVFEDPVFVVANVLLIASPPALTLAQITQAASGDAFERLISRTIFWSYCVLTPPSTILFVVVGLVLAKL
ncbi:uncharacterized protein B0H18DRAFT_1039466 [Fomitopsis serialis]|uniref:uncharacterized protein n=1 Tax=Fomitopsis serialis TaxID=139415 RepID=UPI0020071F8E|nr:uncharacterized protein B0H18DRAFT_1039466 [Neoantrodia serialis]KAH9916052.1 hypothetical protein B0H18DRAFT_1039466 [Neoantrodia serialis]